jgi:hypothetical protein
MYDLVVLIRFCEQIESVIPHIDYGSRQNP